MTLFIDQLEDLAKEDNKIRSVLKKSLSFEAGQFPYAYPYVERYIQLHDEWTRSMHYLVAGLWASHWSANLSTNKISLAKACCAYMEKSKSASVEKRFIGVIDADIDQLAYRLRQLIMLLKDYPIDFSLLLKQLLYWNSDKKITQIQWAKEFYNYNNIEKN